MLSPFCGVPVTLPTKDLTLSAVLAGFCFGNIIIMDSVGKLVELRHELRRELVPYEVKIMLVPDLLQAIEQGANFCGVFHTGRGNEGVARHVTNPTSSF